MDISADDNRTIQRTRLFLLIAGSEALVSAIFSLGGSSESGSHLLFGYSASRLLGIISLGAVGFLLAGIATLSIFRPTCGIEIVTRVLGRFAVHSRAVFTILLAVSLTWLMLPLFFHDLLGLPRWFDWPAVYRRVFFGAAWVSIFSVQSLIWLDAKEKKHPFSRWNVPLLVLFLFAFGIVFCAFLKQFIAEANHTDGLFGQSISTIGDDPEYVVPALNLIRGRGYLSNPVDSPNDYLMPAEIQFDYGSSRTVSYRSPGTPLLMASLFSVVGESTLILRMAWAVIAVLTAVLCLALGTSLAGWAGAMAGGLSGLYYLKYSYDIDSLFGRGRITSEIPAVFWMVLFSVLMFHYLKRRNLVVLSLAGLSLSAFVLTRGNFAPAVILLPAWLLVILKGRRRWDAVLFLVAAILPMSVWSSYIRNLQSDKGYAYKSQGEYAFALTNNTDVLYGVGPDRLRQGNWPPGAGMYQQLGLQPGYHWLGLDENGYILGLSFWWDHFDDLPRLFYVKLRAGTWYTNGSIVYKPLEIGRIPHAIFLGGVGCLALLLGMRSTPGRPGRWKIALQLGLLAAIYLASNGFAFWFTLAAWLTMLAIALSCPYADSLDVSLPRSDWLLVFVLCYFLSTMAFASDGIRYHAPLDPLVMVFGILTPFLILGGWIPSLLGWYPTIQPRP